MAGTLEKINDKAEIEGLKAAFMDLVETFVIDPKEEFEPEDGEELVIARLHSRLFAPQHRINPDDAAERLVSTEKRARQIYAIYVELERQA